MESVNAIITGASLSSENHGVLSSFISLNYGTSSQGFGGYALYLPQSYSHHQKLSVAGHWIWRVMEIAGVTRWDDLIGKTVRVRCTHEKVHVIGHIIKDDWFDPAIEFKE